MPIGLIDLSKHRRDDCNRVLLPNCRLLMNAISEATTLNALFTYSPASFIRCHVEIAKELTKLV